jgi:hypothetical protein
MLILVFIRPAHCLLVAIVLILRINLVIVEFARVELGDGNVAPM